MKEKFIRLFMAKNEWNNILYIHTPFCLQKCNYCVYPSTAQFTRKDFNSFYSLTLPLQIKEFEPILRNKRFNEVYFGGGTPTLAAAPVLEKIFRLIPRFREIPLKSFEASPYTITDEHIALLRRYGFSYISLGVQSLSSRILKSNNRLFVPRRRLKEICRKLEKTGIIFNLDLICYLDKGDTRDIPQFREDLAHVMKKLSPPSITIHYNYKTAKTMERRKALLRLLKESLAHSSYKCVNSLLKTSDARADICVNAEYRLMKTSHDFFNYMWAKAPTMPPWGNNVLSLGTHTSADINLFSYAGTCSFDYSRGKIAIFSPHLNEYSDFAFIRRKMNLAYPPYKPLFLKNTDQKKFLNLLLDALPGTGNVFNAMIALKKAQSPA